MSETETWAVNDLVAFCMVEFSSISSRPFEDTQIWESCKSGKYTARSGYRLLLPVGMVKTVLVELDLGWSRVIVDTAFKKEESEACLATVVVEDNGLFLGATVAQSLHMGEVVTAEFFACRTGVNLAREENVRKLELISDNLTIIKKLKSKEKDYFLTRFICGDIKRSLSDFEDVYLLRVSQNLNVVAHELARDSFEHNRQGCWKDRPPDAIMRWFE